MHKPQKKQTPIINNNKSTKVNKLIKTGKTVKTFKQLVKTNKLVEAGELVIKLDKLERSTKSLRPRKPWMKNHNNNLSRIRKSVKRSSGPLILAKSLKGTKKAVARLLKNKSSININRLKNSKLAQIRRIIKEYRKVKRARENKKKLRYFRDFLLGPRGFEIYAKRRFKWYTEKDFSKNPTFYYIKDRDIYVPERKVHDLDKYIYRFERKLTSGWKFWARRSLRRLELKQCNWAKSLARVLISYSERKKKTPGIRRKHTIASIAKARGGKGIWERTHQRMTLINISERFRVRSRFKSIWHFLHKIPRSIMQKRKEAIVPYYHYKRINHRGGYHFLKVLHWDCRPKWDMSERIWKRRRLVLNTAAYKALRYRVPYYTKIMTAGFTRPIYPYSFLEPAVKTGDKDGDDDEDLRLTNLEFLQYPRKKAYFLQRRVKSLAQRLAIIRVRENRRSISRKFFLSAGIPRHRRQTMDQIFEKEYPRKLKIEFFTPGSHQEWASRRILSWQQRQGKKLYTRKTKNKKRRWRRVYYLQSKFDYKKRVQRRARWAAQHKPTKRVKLLMPVTSRSVRLSLFINTSRSNYFFTLVKSKKKHPKKYSTLKVFTAGNLKNITTARKRRDMTTFERLFMRVLKYLLANQIERLYQIKVKLNPKLKYSAIKKYSIKKILRLYNYKKVYIRALRLQLMRPHAHRRRAPKRRRK